MIRRQGTEQLSPVGDMEAPKSREQTRQEFDFGAAVVIAALNEDTDGRTLQGGKQEPQFVCVARDAVEAGVPTEVRSPP